MRRRAAVSTHSRPKAAGKALLCQRSIICSFNTQPPEGGWRSRKRAFRGIRCFNTQPPEGGCFVKSTRKYWPVSFNTQPPEGGCAAKFNAHEITKVSTHSRPKAAEVQQILFGVAVERFNTQPPEGGWPPKVTYADIKMFQHTAARRRLDSALLAAQTGGMFQHTAARRRLSLSQKPCSIRFRSPDFAKLTRKARTRV